RNLIEGVINPLEIIPIDMLCTVYHQSTTSGGVETARRGAIQSLSKYAWNGSICGKNLTFSNNFTLVTTNDSGFWQNLRIVTTCLPFTSPGKFFWTLTIQACNQDTWIGLCGSDPI